MGRYSLSYCLLVLAWLGASIKNVQAQDLPTTVDAIPYKKAKRFSIGPRIEGNHTLLGVNQVVAEKYSLRNSTREYEGYRLSVFGRYDVGKNYLQADLSYGYSTGIVQVVNLKPEEDLIGSSFGAWTHTGAFYDFRRVEAAFVAGHKLTKWLRVQAGPMLAYQKPDDFYQHPESFYNSPLMRQERIFQDILESYHPYLLSGKIGVGLDLKNFTIDFGYETSLTPLSTRIYYTNQGQSYPLKQSARQLTLGVGFKLVKF